MLYSVLAISIGASVGAVSRWLLALWLNTAFPAFQYGTLAANLAGGYLIGIAMAVFAQHPHLSPEWRLLIVTGFLGGLSTFSTFSAEVATSIQEQRFFLAAITIGSHVLGSVLLTLLGIATVALFSGSTRGIS